MSEVDPVLRYKIAEAKVEALVEVLSFYADPENYRELPTGSPNSFGLYESTECPIWDDGGETARDALRAEAK